MKKSIIFTSIFLLLISFISISIIKAQEMPNAMPEIPVLGTINTETGLPSSFEKFRAISENLSEEESRKQYFYQEWTKMAKSDSLAAVFFYTDQFFSTFNPIWENIFGISFSWSWEFVFCLIIWIMLMVIIYMPVKELINLNQILAIVASVIISSLVGKSGVIKQIADQLAFAVKNIWLAGVCLLVTILIITIYVYVLKRFGHDLKKQSEEEELERAKRSIKIHGKLSEDAIKTLGSE